MIDSCKKNGIEYDQVWVCFDKDDYSNKLFNQAVQLAITFGYKVAYSNQAFEYWFLLHFNDHQGSQMNRKHCCKEFAKVIATYGYTYDCKGSKLMDQKLFNFMRSTNPQDPKQQTFQQQAIERARRNHLQHSQTHPGSPALHESSTTVFQLVEELNRYL